MTGGLLCSSAARRSFAFLLSPVASSSIAVRSTSVSRIIASPGSARTPDLHEPLRRPCAIPPMPRTFRQNSRTIVRPDKNSQRREALMTPNVNFARLFAACLAALPLSAIGSAAALDYPTRPVRWIVTYPPGGGTDITARIIAQWLSERLGQQVFIENKAGGGNNIGTEAALHSPPDGYTLVLTNPANAINATLYPKLSFNFLRDIAPVAGRDGGPSVGPGQDGCRVHRLRQGQSGQDQLGDLGQRNLCPSLGRAVQADDRRRADPYSLQGLGAGAYRHDRRYGAIDVRQYAALTAA